MRLFKLLLLLTGLCLLTSGVMAQQTAMGFPAHYLVVTADAGSNLAVKHHQIVQMRTQPVSLSDSEIAIRAQNNAFENAIPVRLLSSSRSVAFQTVVQAPQWVRGEFHGEGEIDGHHFPLSESVFAIRVPYIGTGSLLEVQSGNGRNTTFDLDALTVQFGGRSLVGTAAAIPGWQNGDPANRVDLLIMGDGYRAAEQAKFTSDAVMIANGWGAIKPYAHYANYVNMQSLFVASQQSGADLPVCPDPDPNDVGNGTMVNTAFDATFCSNNIWRLLTVNFEKVLAAAAAAPDWDKIIIVVNTPIYGGSGGQGGVVSLNQYALEILRHEYGHAFTLLGDEYDFLATGVPACSDTNANETDNCPPNVTNVNNRTGLKWGYWVAPTTSVPTFGPLPDAEAAGLWEGALYKPTGLFRSCFDCLMKTLERPFGYVASEAYALRLYNDGWSSTGVGIRNIEPGTLLPAVDTLTLNADQYITFSGQILAPRIGAGVVVKWLVNDVQVASENVKNRKTAQFTFVPETAGTYTVKMLVTDVSPLIHPTRQPDVTQEHLWTVTAVGLTTPPQNLLSNPGFEDPGTKEAFALNWTEERLSKSKRVCELTPHTGRCAYKIAGVLGVEGRLKQTVFLTGAAGDVITLGGWFDPRSFKSKFQLRVKVFHPGDATASKFSLVPTKDKGNLQGYQYLSRSLVLPKDTDRLKIHFIIKNAGGSLFVDDLSLTLISGLTGSTGLSLPPAP